jgi:hypothetical protein
VNGAKNPESVGAIARRLLVVQSRERTLTEAQQKLVDTSVSIFDETPSARDAAFIARELVLASLPHSNPGDRPLWTRRNGNVTLAIQPGVNIQTGESYGYPYGIIPRLLLFWITTEALRTQSRRLELGSSLSGFMTDLGLSPYTGRGKRGDAKRLRDQMERLFRSRFSLERLEEDGSRIGKSWLDMQVAPQGDLWWSVRAPDQTALWGSWIELGELFYTAIMSAPIPVDMRALRALKRSPLALDLYAWLTFQAYRAHQSRQPRFETWAQLHSHMGGDYADIADFRKKVKRALQKIRAMYPGLRLSRRLGGIEISPASLPAIEPRELAPR